MDFPLFFGVGKEAIGKHIRNSQIHDEENI